MRCANVMLLTYREVKSSLENMAMEGKKSWTRMQVKRSSWRLGHRCISFYLAVVQENEWAKQTC